ncbi:aquaporin-like protein [Usnea florida]
MNPVEPERRERLTPATVANFPGSLAANQLGESLETTSYPQRKGRLANWVAYCREGWEDPGIWKSAFVETLGSFLLCYLNGMIDTTITNFGTPQAPAYAGVVNIFLLTLFIMAFAPGSGGHINPTITFSTMIVGLTGFSRAILYMGGQLLGAGLAGGVLRGAFGAERAIEFKGGGCFRNPGTIAAEQALLIETISSFALLALAFGVALDPRQRELFGPLGGPFAVGCSLGLVSFATAGLVPGYTGASMNPARCFAFAITRHDFTDQWIWWVGPFCGSWLLAITYSVAPPYHSGTIPPRQ